MKININLKNWRSKVQSLLQNRVLLGSLISIGFGLLFGFFVMVVLNPSPYWYEPIFGFYNLVLGNIFKPLTNYANLPETGIWIFNLKFSEYFVGAIADSVPIILTGLAVGFAFRTGLFNIGASGQAYVGGITAIAIALLVPLPFPLHFLVAMLGAILAGALWGFIVGFLKARYNVNEVVASIMMNYIAVFLVTYIAKLPGILKTTENRTAAIPSSAVIPSFGLNLLFPGSDMDIGIFFAIGVAFLLLYILNHTTLGFELKAVGFNKDAAQYAGMKYRRNVMVAMAISGAVAGLAGAMIYLSMSSVRIRPGVTVPSVGFDGIIVALLANSHPVASIFSGLFISYLRKGGVVLSTFSPYKSELIDIILSVIIYFSALSALFLGWIDHHRKKKVASAKGKGE